MINIKNPPMFFLLVAFAFLNLMDIITTLFILRGESNPIYHLTGSIIPVFVLKIAIVALVFFWYKRSIFASNAAYYMLIVILMYGCVALVLAQIGNIYAIFHPALIDKAAAASTSDKVSSYVWFMNLIYLTPILFSWITFIIYDKSIKYITIDREYFRNRRWWKI